MHRLLLILPALLLLAAVACGDDDETADDVPAAPTPADDATPADDGTPAPEPDDDDATPANGEAVDEDEVARLFEGFESANFQVTWQMETDFEGEAFSGNWTWYQDADNQRQRFDFDGNVAGMDGAMSIITTESETFVCMDNACLATPEGQPLFGDPSEDFTAQLDDLDDQVLGGNVRDAGTREIAGVQASCFDFTSPDVDEGEVQGTACVSDQGVPLYTEWESAGERFFMEATSYSDSVSDDDFEPPYPVTQMPG